MQNYILIRAILSLFSRYSKFVETLIFILFLLALALANIFGGITITQYYFILNSLLWSIPSNPKKESVYCFYVMLKVLVKIAAEYTSEISYY